MRRIDFDSKAITGKSGKEYKIINSLPVGRFMAFEKLQAHVGWGLDFYSMFQKLKSLYDLLNDKKFADAAVMVHNLMNGIARNIDKRHHPALQLCTLFIVAGDEDVSTWDEDSAAKKIEDWSDIDSSDFFLLAANTVSGFIETYQGVLESISATGEKVK